MARTALPRLLLLIYFLLWSVPSFPAEERRVAQMVRMPSEATLSLKDGLRVRLSAIASGSGIGIDDAVNDYLFQNAHKAIAAANAAPFAVASAAGLPTAQEAQIVSLERCQILQRTPCTLVAVDNATTPARSDGKWPLFDMARVNYNGIFDPILIPGLLPADRDRADVAGYIRAPGPKAAAVSAGKITIVSGARSQFEAERQVLASCGSGCYLYAVNNKVVLTQHRTEPRPLGKGLSDVLSYALADDAGAKLAKSFEDGKLHKSLAMLPENGGTFWVQGSPSSAEMAQEQALEACELLFNAPCVTIATDGKVLAPDPYGAPARRMPRVTYQGSYRLDMVPVFRGPIREIQQYISLSRPKAMAIRATGAKLRVGTGQTLAEAEANALAQCNDEAPYPCILYAANDQVILPQRRTEPER